MSKTLKDISSLFTKLGTAFSALAEESNGTKPSKASKAVEADDDAEEDEESDDTEESEAEESDEEFSFPSAKEIKKLKRTEAVKLAEKVNLPVEGLEPSEITAHLLTIAALLEGDEAEKEAVDALAVLVGIAPDKKKVENTVKSLLEYFTEDDAEESDDEEKSDESDEDESEESDDDDDEEESEEEADDDDSDDEDDSEDDDEESDEEESDEEESEDEDDDEEEEEETVSEKDMLSRLKAFNAVSKKKIEVKKGKTKLAYAKLVELLTDDDGNVAKWGTPYIRQENGWNCGAELTELPEKNGNPRGKCVITGKTFVFKKGKFVAE